MLILTLIQRRDGSNSVVGSVGQRLAALAGMRDRGEGSRSAWLWAVTEAEAKAVHVLPLCTALMCVLGVSAGAHLTDL